MTCANHPDRERIAFCQNCGKPLCSECARTVGQAVFCEPCLVDRLAAANAAAGVPPFSPGPVPPVEGVYGAVPGAGPAAAYGTAGASAPFAARGASAHLGSSPLLALLIGFFPGVGAMYNGQYAKGVVHLIVFAILVSLTDQNGVFGLFVALWIIYQGIEAYHTARARRDGTPLPNPFGLNDIGERFGFGRSWAGTPAAHVDPTTRVPPPPTSDPGAAAPPFAPWHAQATSTAPGSAVPYTAVPDPFQPAAGANATPQNAPSWTAGSPYAAPFPVPAPATVPPANQFPVGAIVLIGLGVLFLLGSTRLFERFPSHYLLPFLLIGVGVWLFVRRMTSSGASLLADGSSAYQLRLVRALQGSIWVVLVGILFLLDTLRILSWGHSWPLFIIVGGIVLLLQRSAYGNAAQATIYNSYPPPGTPPSGATPAPIAPEPDAVPAPREREEI